MYFQSATIVDKNPNAKGNENDDYTIIPALHKKRQIWPICKYAIKSWLLISANNTIVFIASKRLPYEWNNTTKRLSSVEQIPHKSPNNEDTGNSTHSLDCINNNGLFIVNFLPSRGCF